MKNFTQKYKKTIPPLYKIERGPGGEFISKFLTLLLLIITLTAKAQDSDLEITKKQLELKQHSLFNRIINSIEVRAHAGFGAGYFLSQFDPINPVYSPYAIRDRFSLSISINISKILDNSTYKIKQIELQQLERKIQREKQINKEKISLLEEKIKAQTKIIELYEEQFNQNKITLDKLLEEKIKLLDLKLKLKEIISESNEQ